MLTMENCNLFISIAMFVIFSRRKKKYYNFAFRLFWEAVLDRHMINLSKGGIIFRQLRQVTKNYRESI